MTDLGKTSVSSRLSSPDVSIAAIAGVGAALVVLFAGAGVILAVGYTVPTEFWAAASSLSGALVGILVPPPTSKAKRAVLAGAARELNNLAGSDGSQQDVLTQGASAIRTASLIAPGANMRSLDRSVHQFAAEATADTPTASHRATLKDAAQVVQDASDRAVTSLPVVLLLAVGTFAFVWGAHLALQVGNSTTATQHDLALTNVSDTLIALGSAAGGALVGLLAPTPVKTT